LCFVVEVTFADFAQYVVDEWSAGKQLNRHWRPQYLICNPCHIKYDFVGRFEHLREDWKSVMNRITTSSEAWRPNVSFPFHNRNAFNDSTTDMTHERRKFYAQVSRDVLRKLIRIYKPDYELFGYDYRWACNDC